MNQCARISQNSACAIGFSRIESPSVLLHPEYWPRGCSESARSLRLRRGPCLHALRLGTSSWFSNLCSSTRHTQLASRAPIKAQHYHHYHHHHHHQHRHRRRPKQPQNTLLQTFLGARIFRAYVCFPKTLPDILPEKVARSLPSRWLASSAKRGLSGSSCLKFHVNAGCPKLIYPIFRTNACCPKMVLAISGTRLRPKIILQ